MVQVDVLLIIVVTVWWLSIKPFASESMINEKHFWSAAYMLLSIIGGIFGLIVSKYWGGYKSIMGKAIICFSVGLFLQSFGQIIYNYYTLFAKVEAPYPSLGDLGYFGSIPAYIYGVLLLGRAAGLNISSKATHNQIMSVLIPIIMLIFSYFFFLKGYQFDWSNPLTVLLDFGYPLGQAMYVSLALLVLFGSRKFLGGIMKKPTLLLLFALIIQYICDFNFLYEVSHGNWYAGGWGDYLYAVSYFTMTLAIVYIGSAYSMIKES